MRSRARTLSSQTKNCRAFNSEMGYNPRVISTQLIKPVSAIMSQGQQRQLFLGILAGATASLAMIALRRGQAERATLANRIEPVTQQALSQLGVPAESRYIPVNGLQLHTVIAGPRDGKLVVLLHGFPENWYSWSLNTTAFHPTCNERVQPSVHPQLVA